MDLPVTTSNDTDSGGHSGDSPDWAFAAATKPRAKTAKELHLIFMSETQSKWATKVTDQINTKILQLFPVFRIPPRTNVIAKLNN